MPPIQMPPKVFDRALIARHLQRRPAARDDFVMRLVLADLDERLGTVTRDFERASFAVYSENLASSLRQTLLTMRHDVKARARKRA